jgi:hypothetical protein
MTASHGNRMAAAASPPVSAFPWAEPVATTRRTRCAKRSARSPALTAGSGANCVGLMTALPWMCETIAKTTALRTTT